MHLERFVRRLQHNAWYSTAWALMADPRQNPVVIGGKTGKSQAKEKIQITQKIWPCKLQLKCLFQANRQGPASSAQVEFFDGPTSRGAIDLYNPNSLTGAIDQAPYCRIRQIDLLYQQEGLYWMSPNDTPTVLGAPYTIPLPEERLGQYRFDYQTHGLFTHTKTTGLMHLRPYGGYVKAGLHPNHIVQTFFQIAEESGQTKVVLMPPSWFVERGIVLGVTDTFKGWTLVWDTDPDQIYSLGDFLRSGQLTITLHHTPTRQTHTYVCRDFLPTEQYDLIQLIFLEDDTAATKPGLPLR